MRLVRGSARNIKPDCHTWPNRSFSSSICAAKWNKTVPLISLTDSWGGVDEIQGGGGQRKQEYKPKEWPSPKAQMCRHHTGSRSTHARARLRVLATMEQSRCIPTLVAAVREGRGLNQPSRCPGLRQRCGAVRSGAELSWARRLGSRSVSRWF